MSTVTIILLVVVLVLVIILGVLYFLGRNMQKKKDAQDEQMAAVAQTIPMLIIDKKKMKIKDSGLPASVIAQTPKLMRRSKLPIVKAKVGPKVTTFICDAAVFNDIPLKKEVKATVSGLYITGVKGLRKPIEQAPKKEKKGIFAKLKNKEK